MSLRRSIAMLTIAPMLVSACGDNPVEPAGAPGLIGAVTTGGAPVVGATVTASSGLVSVSTRTRDDGIYTFPDLAAGVWGIEAVAAGITCDEPEVTLRADERLDADLACEVTYDFPGGPGIYLADADGSGATWLVRGHRPDWSPDGHRIAFDREGMVRVVDIDGSGEIELAPGVDPAWSPDGERIVFAGGICGEDDCETRDPGLYLVGADGSGLTRLTSVPYESWFGPPTEPAWSPDGETIAFAEAGGEDGRHGAIYLIDAGGGAARWLWFEVDNQSDPHWTADGSRVVFWSLVSGIASVDPDGSDFHGGYRNFPFVGYGAKPEPSPDGAYLLFTANRHQGDGPFLYLMGPGGPRLLVPHAYDATWSPDGRRIAFAHGDR